MKITIEVECDQLGELTSHLSVLIKGIKKYVKKNKLTADADVPGDLELYDDNCYGTHELKVSEE